jgi:hypothetical protein
MKLPTFLEKYFWDTDLKDLDPTKHSFFIISRLLEFGDEKAISWLFKNFSKKAIKNSLKKAKISPKSLNFWCLFFNVRPNEVSYLKRRFYQKKVTGHIGYKRKQSLLK